MIERGRDPELDTDTIEKLRGKGWIETDNRMIASEAERERIIAIAIRADLDPEAGISRPSATVVLEPVDKESLFVTPVAREVTPGIETQADAMDKAQAEIERQLRSYKFEAAAP